MNVLYFDCFSGISGDMTAGALIDLGVPLELLEDALRSLNLPDVSISLTSVQKRGIAAKKFEVFVGNVPAESLYAPKEEGSEHSHGEGHVHPHGNGHTHHEKSEAHVHRGLTEISKLLSDSSITDGAKQIASKIFRRIAEAEGKVHGMPAERVHFHEVGAVDSILDVIAAAVGIDYLKPDRVEFSKIREGRGFVNCAHGLMPIPAPATLELIKSAGMEMEYCDIDGEMVTPTGAGIAAAVGDRFGALAPAGRVIATGSGAGTRDFAHPNLLRVLLIETSDKEFDKTRDTMVVLETAIDNSTGEELGYASELLFEAGCVDVYFTPIHMKKSRPGVLLTALVPEPAEAAAVDVLFRHTGTIGVRRRVTERHVMERSFSESITPYGNITIKTVTYGDLTKRQSEYESLKRAAHNHGLTLKAVSRRAEERFHGDNT
ncbi:nickel pincer cofactor biosynthesis protein LarC [Oscillospiraceae bacterium OttesenSCG-928-G22]|nr:nickel pincer cofactor biosynthesis protein LarC [Oscillospiraceae bacterium OttesenSCG-928-G22]